MEIKLKNGLVTIIDGEDLELFQSYKWFVAGMLNGKPYLSRSVYDPTTKHRQTIRFHRQIMNTPEGMDTDHINGNSLDNRKANLRICTRSQNCMNKRGKNTSGYVGVCWHKQANKWLANIKVKGRTHSVGLFENSIHAAMARDIAAHDLHGEFATLNFPKALTANQ